MTGIDGDVFCSSCPSLLWNVTPVRSHTLRKRFRTKIASFWNVARRKSTSFSNMRFWNMSSLRLLFGLFGRRHDICLQYEVPVYKLLSLFVEFFGRRHDTWTSARILLGFVPHQTKFFLDPPNSTSEKSTRSEKRISLNTAFLNLASRASKTPLTLDG